MDWAEYKRGWLAVWNFKVCEYIVFFEMIPVNECPSLLIIS